MGEGWPLVALGEVLRQRKQFIEIDDTQEYRRCRVQLHARGVVLRDVVSGADIRTKSQQVCRAGEFLVAEIDAKLGGYGLVADELHGAIVSSHYFLFEIDTARLDRRYIGWFSKTPAFFDQVAAKGSTNYAAIRPADVLRYLMPLPPLEEQRRIVARVEGIAAKVEEAQRLRRAARMESQALASRSLEQLVSSTGNWMPLGDIVPKSEMRNGKSVASDGRPSDVRCLSLAAVRNGRVDIAESRPVPIRTDDASNYLVRPGDVFVVRGNGNKDLVGRAAIAHETRPGLIYPDLLIRLPLPTSVIDPEYFVCVWHSQAVRAQLQDLARTTSGIWKVNQKHLSSVRIPVPALADQSRLVQEHFVVEEQKHAIDCLLEGTDRELGAILPTVLDRAFRGELQ